MKYVKLNRFSPHNLINVCLIDTPIDINPYRIWNCASVLINYQTICSRLNWFYVRKWKVMNWVDGNHHSWRQTCRSISNMEIMPTAGISKTAIIFFFKFYFCINFCENLFCGRAKFALKVNYLNWIRNQIESQPSELELNWFRKSAAIPTLEYIHFVNRSV